MLFMGIDMGTSGCKAVVFDEAWQAVSAASREYSMLFPGDGLLELDAEIVWDSIRETVREANGKAPEPAAAFAISAIGDVIIPIGRDGRPVRPSIVDFDPRGKEEIEEFTARFGKRRFFERTGMPALALGSLAKILWLSRHEPGTVDAAVRWATYEDYVIGRMGLAPTVSFSEAARTMLFDIRRRCWCEEILEAAGIPPESLPAAVPSGQVIGRLEDGAAADLGFAPGALAVAGGHDMVCAAVGAGLDERDPGTAVDICGTIEGLVAALSEPNTGDVMRESCLPCYPGADAYVTFSVNLTAGCVVRWFRDMIAPDWYAEDAGKGRFYQRMFAELDPGVPGPLLLIPHFSGSGNPFFDPEARGVICGLTLDSRREDIARAVAEGLYFELRLHLEAFEQAGIRFSRMRTVGGGAGTDGQLQLKANITGLPVIRGAVDEASAFGAALYAACGAGEIRDPAEVTSRRTGEEKVFYPERQAHEAFEERYRSYRDLSYAVHRLERVK